MPLRFEDTHQVKGQNRELTSDALESFHTAFIGEVEFGHYFRVSHPAM